MEENLFDPYEKAKESGIKVKLIDFKKINSLLAKSVVYLRKSMNKIEKRCSLTYELVHYSRGHIGFCEGHSVQEEDSIRRETAHILIQGSRLYILIESCTPMDKIAQELQVTKDIIYDYFKYCRTGSVNEEKPLEKNSPVAVCKVSAGF